MPASFSERVESAGVIAVSLCMAGAGNDLSKIPDWGHLAIFVLALVPVGLLLGIDLWRDAPWLRRMAGLPPPHPDHNRPARKRLP